MEADKKDQPEAPLGKRVSKKNPKYQSDSDEAKNTSAVKQKRVTKVVSKKSAQLQKHTKGQASKSSPGKTTKNMKKPTTLGFAP